MTSPETDRDRLDLILRLTDLTSLELTDTPESIAALCARALSPDPDDDSVPPVAAVCVYPHLVGVAAHELAGTGVMIASVAGAFPSGVATIEAKVAEAETALNAGAAELDLVIDYEAFLRGEEHLLTDEVSAVRLVSPGARLKVILETGALGDLEIIRRAADAALAAGADIVKTSTGKGHPGASPEVAEVLLEAAAQYAVRHGRRVGVKVSGGVRTTAAALAYIDQAERILWLPLTGLQFRIGASALVDAVVAERRALVQN